jgi:hypothetical protein
MYRGHRERLPREGPLGARKVVELWPLRPDRMWVIPDRERHIRGWEYRLGADVYTLDAAT